jgi:predicted ribosomally synthesized peptide with SipW-like signal peptide
MKKVGLLILVLVFALGALGAGYAYWNQNLVISGTVDTGELSVGVAPGTAPVSTGGASMTIAGNGIVIKDGYYPAIDVGIVDAYPGYSANATVYFKNLGTVPVKVTDVDFTNSGVFDLDNITIGAWTLDIGSHHWGGTGLSGSGGLQGLGSISPPITLASGEVATLVVPITFSTGMGEGTENQNGGFTLTVEAGQFNE